MDVLFNEFGTSKNEEEAVYQSQVTTYHDNGGFFQLLSGPFLQFKTLLKICTFTAAGYRDRAEPVTLEGATMF